MVIKVPSVSPNTFWLNITHFKLQLYLFSVQSSVLYLMKLQAVSAEGHSDLWNFLPQLYGWFLSSWLCYFVWLEFCLGFFFSGLTFCRQLWGGRLCFLDKYSIYTFLICRSSDLKLNWKATLCNFLFLQI